MARRRRTDGPRRAVRWIGDALILEGDLQSVGARAVWRGTKEPRCARARIASLEFDFEFDDDPVRAHVVMSELGGDGLVPRLATYRADDSLAIIDDDVGDLTLRALMEALGKGGGAPPLGLALFVAAELARARKSVASTALGEQLRASLDPKEIFVGWDGRVWARPATAPADVDGWGDFDLDAAAYGFRPPERVIGCLLYQMLAGRHPYAAEGDADLDDDERAELMTARRGENDHQQLPDEAAPEPVRDLVDRLLVPTPRPEVLDELAALAGADDEPFGAPDLAGMLRGLFAERARESALEREDRLSVMPGPRVVPEDWALLDDHEEHGEDGVLDLDDVRRPRWGEPSSIQALDDSRPYEPSVAPVDPFDDDN